MSRLTRIRIEGFRSLRSVDLALGPVTVLIGANGSGKSTLLAALRMMSWLPLGSFQRFVAEAGGASRILHRGGGRELNLSVEVEDGNEQLDWRAQIVRSDAEGLSFVDEQIELVSADASRTGLRRGIFSPESGLAGDVWWPPTNLAHVPLTALEPVFHPARDRALVARVAERFKAMRFLHASNTDWDSRMREPSEAVDDQALRFDGGNIAAFLHGLRVSEDERDQVAWRRINQLIKRIAPAFKVFETRVTGDRVRLHWVDKRDQPFGVDALSDGTLRAIPLVTALAQPAHRLPWFLGIDEPELGLHPAAIELIIELIRSVSSHCQVVVATQSPVILNRLAPEEVVVTEWADGAASFRQLESEQLAVWLKQYSLAELWEKNLLGGLP
jgi:predicted ATPase